MPVGQLLGEADRGGGALGVAGHEGCRLGVGGLLVGAGLYQGLECGVLLGVGEDNRADAYALGWHLERVPPGTEVAARVVDDLGGVADHRDVDVGGAQPRSR